MMKSELIPLNGDPPIPITRDVTLIGRREYCDVVVSHPSLSKRHCLLVRTDGLLIVRDLISTNGTKVNGQRVMWAALLPNDRLTVGRYKFKVYLGSDDALSPSEQRRRGTVESVGVGLAAAANVAKSASAPCADDPYATQAPTGFAAPSPLSMPALASPAPAPKGSTDPDADLEILEDDNDLEILEDDNDLEIIDEEDDDQPFILDLD